jgi:hypothetical protein
VLTAIGLSRPAARASIRIGIGRRTTPDCLVAARAVRDPAFKVIYGDCGIVRAIMSNSRRGGVSFPAPTGQSCPCPHGSRSGCRRG